MARRQSGDAIRFVTTQFTLLVNLARGSADEINPRWGRFFDLYYPTMVKYAEMFCAPQDAEDIAQGVLVRLVDVMRSGGYERRPGVRFSTYVKTLVRNEFIDWRRREAARGLGRTVPLSEKAGPHVEPDAAARIDAEWRLALRAAATDHVLSRTAMPDDMRRAYRAYVLEGRPAGDVARELGVRRGYVLLAKTRIDARIAAVEAMYGE